MKLNEFKPLSSNSGPLPGPHPHLPLPSAAADHSFNFNLWMRTAGQTVPRLLGPWKTLSALKNLNQLRLITWSGGHLSWLSICLGPWWRRRGLLCCFFLQSPDQTNQASQVQTQSFPPVSKDKNQSNVISGVVSSTGPPAVIHSASFRLITWFMTIWRN